jgi:ABC-type transporter Mla subunit MlaD
VAPKYTRKQMTHVEFFKLCDHLRTHRERVTTEKPYLTVLADHFTEQLGFHVTADGIKKAQQATGIVWETPISNSRPQGIVLIQDVAARQDDLAGALSSVSSELETIRGVQGDHQNRFQQFAERVNMAVRKAEAAEAAGVNAANAAQASHDLDKEERDKLAAALAEAQRSFKDHGHRLAQLEVDLRRACLAVVFLYQRQGLKFPKEVRQLFDALPPLDAAGAVPVAGQGLKGGL